MNYTVIRDEGRGLIALELAVKQFTEKGWVPTGGPFRDSDSRQWCQALVKRQEQSAYLPLKEPFHGKEDSKNQTRSKIKS